MLSNLLSLFVVFFLLVSGGIYADWNQDFSETTQELIEQFPALQTRSYLDGYTFFLKARNQLLHDRFLQNEMLEAGLEDKLLFLKEREGCLLKKRSNDNIKEAIIWELSILFGIPNVIVPAFAVEIGGKKVVIQKMEEFFIGDIPPRIPPFQLVRKVPLVSYWKAHFLAYILGMRDLVGRNIGVNTRGFIRFFDAEDSFCYSKKPTNQNGIFYVPFLTQAFEWPQYRAVLDSKDCEELQKLQSHMLFLKGDLARYFSLRKGDFNLQDLFDRIDQVAAFPLEEGVCFRDFYGFLFPKMNQGLDELNKIIGRILRRKVDHGAALFHAMGKHRIKTISYLQRKDVMEWIDYYVE